MQLRKKHVLLKIINGSLIELPTPSTITIMWNLGSLLGICLITQILTGLFLSMHYSSFVDNAFTSVVHICQNVNYGWMFRSIHANGASFFFICMYLHIGRGMYYNSFTLLPVWTVGSVIFFLTMMTAFIGYVLPWGQMSFWGATVITNLLSAIPFVGEDLVQWVWGGFSVSGVTLNRFFVFHFLFPFIILAFVIIHLMFLHQTGSKNPLGLSFNMDKLQFHPYYTWKDLFGVMMLFYMLLYISLYMPYMLGDPDNFIKANPMVTPIHIQPEWYFLFAYAILRTIPSKLGGVIALIMSVMILFIVPFLNYTKFSTNFFLPLNQFNFWILVVTVMLLSWMGASPVEKPYLNVSVILTIMYFSLYILNPLYSISWMQLLKK